MVVECLCFNTASGKYCCNDERELAYLVSEYVSIPQAVSTVATLYLGR